MSYDRYRFTYGVKTTAQINALTDISEGQSVWNSDIKKPEYVVSVSGNLLWSNEDCIVMQNKSGSTMVEGNVVRVSKVITGVTSLACVLPILDGTGDEDDTVFGVVFRGAVANGYVVVAQQGVYNVKMSSTGTPTPTSIRGDMVALSSTIGCARRIQASSPTTLVGIFGIQLQALTNAELAANNYLTKCMIQNFSAW